MNMYGWTTWGRIDTADLSDYYRSIGPFQLFKHWTGPIVAVPESIDRTDAFLMLAHMNDHLEVMRDER
jgi:hypothetical protein